MQNRPHWPRDGQQWPNREASQFVRAAGFRWHVQIAGNGPAVLLLHGTGAATHSWRSLLPLLSERYTVVAPDLPGHGFTDTPPARALSLPGMAAAVDALLRELSIEPTLAAGHSAGAAVLAVMALDGMIVPRALVSLNGALLPLRGGPGDLFIFSALARMLVSLPLVPLIIARRAGDRRAVERLLRGTGSTIDSAGVDAYAMVVRHPGHVAAALGMMAAWDLHPLARALPRLQIPLTLVVGENDLTIPPSDAQRVRALIPTAKFFSLPHLGHLAHEEDGPAIAAIIDDAGMATKPSTADSF
ncbi:alpha/beta fold hydrolase BchO [Elioraea sp.]|uniref:alpha/beta fold hydrolase BchO n=1 Tax=Elioraea sp. TaxID=2185103 RepID=UPI0025BFE6E3|nr:alpha/beta fold hydrolase BchO [Elioraea sp.]